MVLSEWLLLNRVTWPNSAVEKYMNTRIVEEVSMAQLSTKVYNEKRAKAPFKTNYIYSFVILENGKAVGLNENPAIGITTPIVNYKTEL